MLLFIGGAARSGKGILARRLLREVQIPYLSLDVLKMGLTRGVPEYAIDPNAGGPAVAERMWPLIYQMSQSLLRDCVDYVFEGELLPAHVAALRAAHPSQVAGCFLGYRSISPEEKLYAIRTFGGHPNDWPQEVADDDLLSIVRREIAFSTYLHAECTRCNLPYFDTAQEFAPTIDCVVTYIQRLLAAQRHRA
jgi:hypothetical protein